MASPSMAPQARQLTASTVQAPSAYPCQAVALSALLRQFGWSKGPRPGAWDKSGELRNAGV